MEAGKRIHWVTLQRAVPAQDPTTGAVTTSWVDVAGIWAAIEPLSGRDFIAAQAAQSEVVARIVIPFRTDIDATMRLLHAGKVFSISAVLPDKRTGREYLTLPCSQGVTSG